MTSKISVFKNAFAKTPTKAVDIIIFLQQIKEGHWKEDVVNVRSKQSNKPVFSSLKNNLAAVTISGHFKSRDSKLKLSSKLIKHSGFICLDIDAKDNPTMSIEHIIDDEAFAEFVSCSGKGKKIIYRCTPVKDENSHTRIYDAAIQRLEEKGIKIKVDSKVSSIVSLQYIS
jgi:hypothetical protein